MAPTEPKLRYPNLPVNETQSRESYALGKYMIASPQSSSTATYIELQMQTIFFAKHLFQHRCHDLPKHLSLARANAMDGLDLSRDNCSYQQ
jgi:hypothetical protein